VTDQFSHTREYQLQLLSLMLNDHDFCLQASNWLSDEDFADKPLQWFYDKLANAEPKLTSVTLKEEMIRAAKAKVIKGDQLDKYLEYFGHLKESPPPMEREHIVASLTEFIRTQAMKRAIIDGWDLIQQGEWDQVTEMVTEASRAGLDIFDMGTMYFQTYEDRLASRLNAEPLYRLPTMVPELDNIIGGLDPGQLGLIVGGTGRGKSIFLQWLARVAVMLGKKVVYFTHEMTEAAVADRFDALFTKTKINELKTYNEHVFKELSKYEGKFGKSLCIKEYPADEATVHTLKAFLSQLAGIGFVPDLVIVDYLDLLKPHRNYNSVHEELDAITKSLHGLAKQLRTRVYTASQLNRGGLVADTPDESMIAGAIAKLFTPDVVLFMAQTMDEKEDEIMRLVVSKNRNGPQGRSIQLDTNYSQMCFYRSPISGAAEIKPNTNEEVVQDIRDAVMDAPSIEVTAADTIDGVSITDDLVILD
jgi:replicative DNA helicase